jgi:uncharacterized membrane protein
MCGLYRKGGIVRHLSECPFSPEWVSPEAEKVSRPHVDGHPLGRAILHNSSRRPRSPAEGMRVTEMNRGVSLPIKLFHGHVRFWISLAFGIATYLFLPASLSVISRTLISWDGGVTLFLLTIYLWMRRLTPEQICSHYLEEDPAGPIILAVVVAAAVLSLLAIVEPLSNLRHLDHDQRIWQFALVAVTLIDSWLLVPVMFTMHYADMFYSAPPKDRPLLFPRTELPGFWDFAYFSFTIAAACQTADVSTTAVSIRRAVIVHEIVSFAFNVAIVGFAINITAGLIAS